MRPMFRSSAALGTAWDDAMVARWIVNLLGMCGRRWMRHW